MKHALLLLSLALNFLFTPFLFAQQRSTYTISGSLYDVDMKEPLIQASIRILKPADSTFVTGGVSDMAGNFKITGVKEGDYITYISFIGMNDVYKNISLKGSNRALDLGRIDMSTSSIMMNEVVITEKAVEVVMRNDTIEYNAASYKTQEGAVMEDLLKKMPGVEVDSEGKITVNGKEIKKILLDGKEFFFDDPTVASKNLPVEMIEKIQVLDRRSEMAQMTGFNDDEEETVINLTVKEDKKRGWFGNVLGGGGMDIMEKGNNDARYEGNFMVNRFYKNNQFSILGGTNNTNNMGFNDLSSTMFQGMGGGNRRGGGWRGPGNGITKSRNLGFNFSSELSSTVVFSGDAGYTGADAYLERKSNEQNFLQNDTTLYKSDRNTSNTLSDNFSTNLRLEWKPDTMTMLIFRPRFSYSKSTYHQIGEKRTLNHLEDSINNGWSSEDSNGNGLNTSATLDFSRKLNPEGRVITVGLRGSYGDSHDDGFNRSDIYYYNNNAIVDSTLLDQQLNFGNTSYSYRASTSWVEPLGRRNYMQFSYRVIKSYSEALRNTYDRVGLNNNGEYMPLNPPEIDPENSRSSSNSGLRQRAGVAFKSERDKFNYTVGVNLDPSTSHTETFIDHPGIGRVEIDSLDYTRKVVNLSPQLQFRYNFDKRTNLRVDMEGRTNQPSITQLQPVVDVSDPMNLVKGNPDLKPSYRQNMRGQFQFFKPESQFSLSTHLNGNLTMNDIVSTSILDAHTGIRTTTYTNVNGNWDGSLAVIINSPLKNRKFNVSSFTRLSYNHRNGFVNGDQNSANTTNIMEGARINYRSDLFDLGLNGRVAYRNTQNSLQGRQNQQTFDYNTGATGTLYLPLNFNLDSDVNFDTNSGYSDGYKVNTWILNASVSKQFLKGNKATVRFKVFDILNQRTSVRRSESATAITDTEYNTIGRYFMAYFVYRFNTFGDGKIPGQGGGGDRR